MSRKDVAKLLREAERQGFTVSVRKSGHVMVFGPDGRAVTTFSGSASDWRALRNSEADLKRAGFRST